MKCISWNVNGIRACITKGFEDRFRELDADIFCLQETKCQQGQVTGTSGLSSVLELCKQTWLFRNCGIYKERADLCEKWYRN